MIRCAEELHLCFPAGHFDVVHIRNALDHSFDPVLGIERMLHAVRPGGWVLLRHARNEGVAGKFRNGHLVLSNMPCFLLLLVELLLATSSNLFKLYRYRCDFIRICVVACSGKAGRNKICINNEVM